MSLFRPRAFVVLSGLLLVAGCGGGTVTPPSLTLRSIAVTGSGAGLVQVQAGQTVSLTATATMSDNSTQNVTTSSAWSSSNNSVATVSAGGVVTGISGGQAEIRAVKDSITGTVAVQVNASGPPVVTGLSLSGSAAVTIGQSAQWTATLTLSDGSTQNVTSTATWSSANTSVASVSSTGLVTGVGAGTVDIRAVSGILQQTRPVQVTKAVQAAFTVTPNPDTLAQGVLAGQCGVFPNGGSNTLRCTFDASSSIPGPGITSYKWEIPYDPLNPGVKVEGPTRVTVMNQGIICGYGLSGTGTGAGAAVVKKVKLTVVGPGGVEDTITPDVTFIRAGGC